MHQRKNVSLRRGYHVHALPILSKEKAAACHIIIASFSFTIITLHKLYVSRYMFFDQVIATQISNFMKPNTSKELDHHLD